MTRAAEGGALPEAVAGSLPIWLVWSNEHVAWWGPNRSGYYVALSSAGRYTYADAVDICNGRDAKWPPNGTDKEWPEGNPPEVIVPAPEWAAAIARTLPPPVAPVAPSFDAALAALDVESDYAPDRGVTHTILGLDDVRAAHAAIVATLAARIATLEAALRKIAAAGPSKDPCADEYDADGKRWTYAGGEATWCTYESDESREMVDHAADVAAYSLAVEARAALEAK